MINMAQFYPYPMGVHYFEEKGTRGWKVAWASDEEDCGIVLFDRNSNEELGRYPFSVQNRVGNVFFHTITGIDSRKVSYLFYEGDKLIADRYATSFAAKDSFGEEKDVEAYRACVDSKAYAWGEDKLPKIPYEECIAYCMHVRGFTKHNTSGVKAKGTFAGIVEKIPYLKDLGVTTLELQPAYEFNEKPRAEIKKLKNVLVKQENTLKINYWGYQDAFYYTPKRGYAKNKDAGTEFKDMVKALHENQMEVVMQFYFTEKTSPWEILNILRFWRITYHVDGFHLMGSNLPVKEAAQDAYLSDCKLWYYDFPVSELYQGKAPQYRNLAVYNDGYLYDLRRFLKGDEGMNYEVMKHMRTNPSTHGVINYLSNYYGLTMADMFSYERKHNEANEEENKDGNDYNCSWNCGAEGPTRKKQILALRQKQVRNAFTLLMLSQGTPLFFMGDEFGNSQKGNNNPYCQDNDICWLNWKDLERNKELFVFVKEMIGLRKEYGVFHQPKECMLIDYKSCGYPDMSYHGSEAWKPSWDHYCRHVGMMLCGEYVQECKGSFFYVAVNMHWEEHEFALPKLAKGMSWRTVLATGEGNVVQDAPKAAGSCTVAPRSIVVFKGSK